MKIFSNSQIRKIDALSIQNEPVSSIDLMERAAIACFDWICSRFPKDTTCSFKVFCGTGNNGGDGLAIARLLIQEGYKAEIYLICNSEKRSVDNLKNEQRLKGLPIEIHYIKTKNEFPEFSANHIIIDTILGTGLNKPVEGLIADVINRINDLAATVIAIDIPSGLFADSSSTKNKSVIKARYTLTFQFPKLAFFFPENEQFVGKWEVLSIGLNQMAIEQEQTKNYFILSQDIKPLLKKRSAFSHKGSFGHLLLIAGSYGKTGAAVLAARASIRSGLGLCTLIVPECSLNILQTAVPEVMVKTSGDKFLDIDTLKHINKTYRCIAIGPGIGQEENVQEMCKGVIQASRVPMVLDADALNILSLNKDWLPFLPKESILTPHPKEFERLAGKWENDFEKQQIAINFAIKYGVYLVLKGAYTIIACPDATCYFNSTGNAGMAKGGSGDVLTGIIGSLLSRGYTPHVSCMAGVFIHGLAADIAVVEKGEESMIASDIIETLGKAFLEVL